MRTSSLSVERRQLLDRLLATRGLDPARPRIPRTPRDRDALPLSFAQQRIWFLNRMLPEETIYNVAGAAWLRGPLDVDLMRRCLLEVVRRHEVLRTTYHPGPDGKGVQRVQDVHDIDLPVIDVSNEPDPHAAAHRVTEREVRRPFALDRDLMVRPVLLRSSATEHLMVLCQHHVATDGWSINLLIGEIAALYEAFSAGRPSPLQPLEVQYGDFAVWQREWLTSERVEPMLDYWRERLTGARLVDAATGLPRPTALTWDGGTLRYHMPASLVGRLTELAESERATPYMALVAAYSVVLARWSGQDDVIIGCPVAGRTRGEVNPLIGCFINELPLRLDLSGRPTFRSLLSQAREVCLGAYANQDVPFEKVVEAVNPERDAMSHAPLVRHQLGLHNEPVWSAGLADLQFEVATLSTGTARFDLEVDLTIETSGDISGMIYFSTDLYREDVVRHMLDRLTTVVAGAVEAPDAVVWHLPLLGPEEWDAVTGLASSGDTRAGGGPVPTSLQGLVEQWAERTPDAVALAGSDPWSYDRLDRRANQLGHWLRHLGVHPDQPVGVCLPSSPTRALALLGVLKSGGCLVPVDPAGSAARVRDLLATSGARIVLTDADTLLDDRLRLVELPSTVRMVALDTVAERIDANPTTRPDDMTRPEHLAVQTVGADAALVTHGGALQRLRWAVEAFGVHPGDVVRLHPMHDGVWEELWPLAAGARLVTGPAGVDDVDSLVAHSVSVLRTTASQLRLLLRQPDAGRLARTLRLVVLGTEDPWPALAGQVRNRWPGVKVTRLRGVAGAALDMLPERVVDDEPEPRPGLGPVDGVRPVVLDAFGELTAIGVPGLLAIGADHLPRAALVPDPTGRSNGLYPSGLRARWLPEGRLEVLGRAQDALVVNRHRVEQSELTACLAQADGVERALVMAAPSTSDATDDDTSHPPEGTEAVAAQRILAYVTLLDQDGPGNEQPTDATRFAQAYSGRAADNDPVVNLGGWTSPSTGEFLSAGEMKEWSDGISRRVLDLRPRSVLEIGCRTGSLLFKVAPRCDTYTAIDLSARALNRVRQHQDWLATKAQDVTLLERGPADLDDLAAASLDLVVVNSLVSYCPSMHFVAQIVRSAARLARPGGAVLLSDVRSLPLARAMHLSAPWGESDPDDSAQGLLGRVDALISGEEELLVHPSAWHDLAARTDGVTALSVLPKLGRGRNELALFRYDVVLHLGASPPPAEGPDLHWQRDCMTNEMLRDRLAESPACVEVRGVPDLRLAVKLQACDLLERGAVHTVGELTESITSVLGVPGGPVDPSELVATARDCGYHAGVVLAASGRPGEVDVTLRRVTDEADHGTLMPRVAPRPGTGEALWTNDPVRATRISTAVPVLRSHLQTSFPPYMIPEQICVLDEWPLRDGTVDRDVLPVPVGVTDRATAAHREPSTETERVIAKVWCDALGLDRIGVHDDFFALGGHSLLGAEVVEKVRDVYDVDLPLGRLFESPTVAASAEYIDAALASGTLAASLAGIQRIDRSSYQPSRSRETGAKLAAPVMV